jgi:hypothetical protein
MTLLALPLLVFLGLKTGTLRRFVVSSLVSFVAIYTPTLVYANLGSQFLGTILIRAFAIYSYEWIPILAVASLTATFALLQLTGRLESRRSSPLASSDLPTEKRTTA